MSYCYVIGIPMYVPMYICLLSYNENNEQVAFFVILCALVFFRFTGKSMLKNSQKKIINK